MGPANCSVVGCSNSTQKLNKWRENHTASCREQICCCDPPFRLYMFPSIKRNSEKRKQWVQMMKRETVDKKPWTPRGSDRVCSEHFVDGEPTEKNPNPTLHFGYQQPADKITTRRDIVKHPLKESSKRKLSFKPSSTMTADAEPSINDNTILMLPPMSSLFDAADIQSPI